MKYLTTNGQYILTENNQRIIIKKGFDMNEILKNLGCGDGQFTGSGRGKCDLKSVGQILGIILVQADTDLTGIEKKEVLDKLIKDGVAFPYTPVFDFEQTTADNPVITSGSGRKARSFRALPEFTFTFDGGMCQAKSLANKLNGDWDLVIVSDKGEVVTTNKRGTITKGFKLQYQDVGTYKFMNSAGTEAESVTFMVQFADANEFNERMEILLFDNTDYDSGEIKGAEDVALVGEVKAGTEITVTVVNACNYDAKVVGIEEATNWKVNGVEPTNVTANVSKPGEYTLTVASLTAGEDYRITLNAEDIAGGLYIGMKKGVVASA